MLSDPICALATPSGRSALAVVRLSGRDAFRIARTILSWSEARAIEPRRAILAGFHSVVGEQFDQGLVTFFSGPNSYTGEDLVEFCCHGGLLAPGQLLVALQSAGARQAEPGEFTRRAVQNGKLDLLKAEAIGDLVDSKTRAQARAALRQLEGGLSARIATLRTELIDLLALLTYDIDFPDEDDGPLARGRVGEALAQVGRSVDHLIATAPVGERLRQGALVVLAGRPNAGKSSLFNALLGTNRALVTEVAGTTRDAIEADLDLDGWPVRLADTAGLRQSKDWIEQLGIEVSQKYLAAADLILLCIEAGRPLEGDELAWSEPSRTIVVRTKSDLASDDAPTAVSVVTGSGLDRLKASVVSRLFGEGGGYPDLEPLLTRERHRTAFKEAGESITEAISRAGNGGDAVLIAHHVRQAVSALDELIGVVDVEAVLSRVFATFCVGK